MILKYPTGLYRSVIPQNPQDGGNVTYTISNTIPPRTNLIYPKVPAGVVLKQRVPRPQTPIERRNEVGDLIYSVSSANRIELGNSSQQYEWGQVLEFGEMVTNIVDPMFVGPVTELRHDTNIFDSDMMGLTSDEVELIANSALEAQLSLTEQLNNLRQQRADTEAIIKTQQKAINEVSKTISALEVTIAQAPNPGIVQVIQKLQQRRDEYVLVRDQAIQQANGLATDAEEVLDKLRTVAVVVK